MNPEYQMDPEQAKSLEMAREAERLLERHGNGQIVLSDRVAELCSFLCRPVFDEQLRALYEDLERLLIEGYGDQSNPEIKQVADAIDERIRSAAEELTTILDGATT